MGPNYRLDGRFSKRTLGVCLSNSEHCAEIVAAGKPLFVERRERGDVGNLRRRSVLLVNGAYYWLIFLTAEEFIFLIVA
jgi:hypothetical protein